jgi:hypothetical protein
MSGERSAPGQSAAFERHWRNLSPGERAELEFRWTISRLWRRGPLALSEFLFLFVPEELREPFALAIDEYLADEHIGRRARASARNRHAGQRWRQRRSTAVSERLP